MKKTISIYDWDETIIKMPSKTFLEEKQGDNWVTIGLTAAEYAIIKYDPNFRASDDSFFAFYDNLSFVNDLSLALSNSSFGPSYPDFRKRLIEGGDFAIITARGQSPGIIQAGVLMIIMKTFTDEEIFRMTSKVGNICNYLANQSYYPVSSDDFNYQFGTDNAVGKTKNRKKIALDDYLRKTMARIIQYDYEKINIVFCDDDCENIEIVEGLFRELKDKFPTYYAKVEFELFNVSEKNKKEIRI